MRGHMRNRFQPSRVDTSGRFEEIDMARGIAILMMILYHTLFDLAFFKVWPVNVATGFWRYFAFLTASLFLLIVGVSLTVSHARAIRDYSKDKDGSIRLVKKYVRRGGGIFACGLLVTIATWLYLGEGFVIFGILHLIGVSVMLAPLFFRFKKGNILIGVLCIGLGIVLLFADIAGPIWLVWLGIHPSPFISVDYTPLLPWFGVVLIGMGVGEYLYPDGKRSWSPPQVPVSISALLAVPGRHSLLIYLVHQPLILLLLHIIAGVPVLG